MDDLRAYKLLHPQTHKAVYSRSVIVNEGAVLGNVINDSHHSGIPDLQLEDVEVSIYDNDLSITQEAAPNVSSTSTQVAPNTSHSSVTVGAQLPDVVQFGTMPTPAVITPPVSATSALQQDDELEPTPDFSVDHSHSEPDVEEPDVGEPATTPPQPLKQLRPRTTCIGWRNRDSWKNPPYSPEHFHTQRKSAPQASMPDQSSALQYMFRLKCHMNLI